MRSRPVTPTDAGDTVPGPHADQAWHPTGNGVVFFDTEQQHREGVAKSRLRSRHWALVVIALAAVALGTTAAIAFDWLPFDAMVTTALPD